MRNSLYGGGVVAEFEMVYATIVGSLFGILGLLLINRNWFKKMRFKTELDLLKAKNRVEIKRLEKQINIDTPRNEKIENSQSNLLTQIAPLLKNLDGEQIASLIDAFTGGGQEAEAPEGLSGLLQDIVSEHPELVQGFLQGIGKNKGGAAAGNY